MTKHIARTEDSPEYRAHAKTDHAALVREEDMIIAQALRILEKRAYREHKFESPNDVRDYLSVRLSGRQRETFGIVLLDSQHRVVAMEDLFTGTLTQTSVYPREVVKAALKLNAGAVVLYHNHPSGVVEPSRADEMLTQSLKTALQTVDVRVIDHIIVGGGKSLSFAERGLL